MLPTGEEQPHGIEDITKKLYSRDENAIQPDRAGVLHTIKHKVQNTWTPERKEQVAQVAQVLSDTATKTSFFKKFFVGAGIFFVFAIALAAYFFLNGSRSISIENVSINILGNAFTQGGEPLPLTLEIGNKNATPLELTDLVIEYPRSGTDLTDPTDVERIRESIGTIASGELLNHKTTLTLYGKEGTTKRMKFTLQFHVPGSNAIFQREKEYAVTISSAPITLTVSGPNTTTANQEYTATISIAANTSRVIPDMLVRVDYPTGFKFLRADPAPAYLSNIWDVGTITPGKQIDIKITGRFNAEDGDERSLRVFTGERDSANKNAIGVVYQSVLHTVDIVRPFIEAHLVINGQRGNDVVISPRAPIAVEIPWANNLPTTILNGQIKVSLSGELIDKASISPTGGFYNSSENTITWNRDTDGAFALLNPGAGGSVGFTFKTFGLYSNNQIATNPAVTISVSISGEQPQEGNFLQSVDSAETRTAKLTTDFALTGAAFYRNGPFTNTGPLPPKVDGRTTYTIKWTATSSANSVKNVVVKAKLPAYVHFLSKVSPDDEDLSLDPLTGEVIWNIGTVPRGAGFTVPAKDVFFQVELAPSLSQLGGTPTLILEANASGIDSYTSYPLTARWREITTSLFNDANYSSAEGTVVN